MCLFIIIIVVVGVVLLCRMFGKFDSIQLNCIQMNQNHNYKLKEIKNAQCIDYFPGKSYNQNVTKFFVPF